MEWSKPLQNLDWDRNLEALENPICIHFWVPLNSGNLGIFWKMLDFWELKRFRFGKEFLPLHQPFTWCGGELSGFRFFLFFGSYIKRFSKGKKKLSVFPIKHTAKKIMISNKWYINFGLNFFFFLGYIEIFWGKKSWLHVRDITVYILFKFGRNL